MAFVREDVLNVTVNQICQRMPFRFSSIEMSPFQYGTFRNLCPFFCLSHPGEGCCEWWSTFTPNFDTIDLLPIPAWTLLDGCHVVSPMGDRRHWRETWTP